MISRANILDTAKELTCGDRDQDYGSPVPNHIDIARGWEVLLGTKITPAQVALCMVWVKACRTKTSPQRRDHYDDMAAYAAIAGECANVG